MGLFVVTRGIVGYKQEESDALLVCVVPPYETVVASNSCRNSCMITSRMERISRLV
jgi:hypothetical protein